MNNIMASAVLDSSSHDPYAFPMDDAIVEEASGDLDSSGRGRPLSSLYSKKFLSQKSSATNGKALPADNGFYLSQNEHSMPQYSVGCDSLSVVQHVQGTGFSNPETKPNNSAKFNEVFSNVQLPESGLAEHFAFSGHLECNIMPVQNGTSSWTISTENESSKKTNKKKRKNKVASGEGNDLKRRTKKTVKNILESGSETAGPGKGTLLPWPNQGISSSDSQYLSDNHAGILCAKNAAPQLPVKSSLAKIPAMGTESSCWGLPVQCERTTTAVTIVSSNAISNGKYVKCTPSTLRQMGVSVEPQDCRPASSVCDTSGKSDSNNKQVNSIPLSKVMEIIEREKARGSPSPCKRRRSAKPQHIQNAEEEARKFVSAAAANNIEKRVGGVLTPGNQRTHTAKKGLDDSLHCSGLKAEGTVSSKKIKKSLSSGLSCPDTCSTGELPKAKDVFHEVASQNGRHASTSEVLYGEVASELCNSLGSSSVNPQTQSYHDSLGSNSVCGSDIQQHFTHQRDSSQTPVPSVNDNYSQQPCTGVQLTGSTSSSTQFDTLSTSSSSPANFTQLYMQFSTYQEQTLPSPCHGVFGNTETSSIPSFKNSFYDSHTSLPSQPASPTQWPADSPEDSSASGIIPQTVVNFSQSVNNPQQKSGKTRSQGVSVSTACTEWKPFYNGSISETDSFPLHHDPASPSSFSASCQSKPAQESASLNCSPGPDKLHISAVLPSFGALVANSIGSHGEQTYSQLNKTWPQTKVDTVTMALPQQQQKKKSVRNKQKSAGGNMGNMKKHQGSSRIKSQNPLVYEGNVANNFPVDVGSLHSPIKLDASSVKSEVKVNTTQTYRGSHIVSSPSPGQELPSSHYLVQSPSQTLPSPSKPPPLPYWQMPSVSRETQSPDQPLPSPRQPTHSPVPKMEPFLMPSTPEEELEDRLRYNKVESAPQCGCLGPNYVFNESVEGPYYTQLGTARDLVALRQIMEKRTGLSGNAIRIEKIHYTGKEGRSAQGCPIAKWIIRRSGLHEKYLCVTRKRRGHFCDSAYIIVAIVAWEGVATERADNLYTYLVSTLTKFGFETDRRCGTNEQKTCACQGADIIRRGASFSFGCSWSMYFNGCKFGRSHTARKFKLKDAQKETEMEEHMQNLATVVAPLYKAMAPDAYRNQVHFEEQSKMCRLGKEKGKPFSGVTACVDFCAHSHKDFHNMQNGSTVVVTLTKHRGLSKPDDEQLHVLPLYVLDNTDENGSVDGQMEKVKAGSLEILHKYTQQARTRSTPVTPKKRVRTPKKDSPAKSEGKRMGSDKADPSSAPSTPTRASSKEKDTSFFQSQDSSHSLSDASTISGNSTHTPEKIQGLKDSSFIEKENLSGIEEDIWSQAVEPLQLYDKMWDYLYSNGAFPPPSCVDKKAAAYKLAVINPQSSTGDIADGECKSLASSFHMPSHPMQQAASVPSPHLCTSSDPEKAGLFAQHTTSRVKVEAGSNPNNACEFQNLRNNGFHDSSSTSHGLSSQVPGATDDLSRDVGIPISTVLGTSLDVLSEAAFVNGQALDQSSLCPPLSSCLPQLTSTPDDRPSLSSATFLPSLACVPPATVAYPITTTSHSTSDNQSSNPLSNTTPFFSAKTSCDGENPDLCNDPLSTSSLSSSSQPVMQPNGSFIMPTLGQGPNEPTFTMMDPSVVKCEWQDNEELFLDPNIGGVAIALNHGAVLFEVAKREVHATTALKNPNRYQPTRISLVFYQHKNLNYSNHGYYEYEHKLKAQRQKRMEKLMEEGATAAEAEMAVKPGRKKRKKVDGEEEEEVVDFAKTSAAQYKYMWDTTVRHSQALTTDSIITRWIDPQPMVTGPYQRWV